jgi:hypothetical protein
MSNKPVKHGIYAWLENARIAPSIRGYRRIRKYLRQVQDDLIQSLGGNERVTIQQRLLIDSSVRMLGVILLAWLFVERAGPMRPDSLEKGVLEFQPAVHKELIAATNALRQNLLALGLESRAADEILDLRRYLELKAQEKSGKFRNEKPSEPRIQQGQGSSSAVLDEKRGSESLLDEKSPAGQGSDIGQSGAIGKDGEERKK